MSRIQHCVESVVPLIETAISLSLKGREMKGSSGAIFLALTLSNTLLRVQPEEIS